MDITNTLSISLGRKSFVKHRYIQKAFTLIIVLMPILLPYQFLFTSYSVSTVLSALLVIVGIGVLWTNKPRIRLWSIFFLLVFFIYAIFNSGVTVALSFAIAIIVLISLTTGYVDSKHIRKYIEIFSIVAALAVILQTIIHYLIGSHLPLVAINFCTKSIQEQYQQLVNTGISDGHYRPSAFFLEPAHYTQFSIFGLTSCLFRRNKSIKKALIITLGIVATTSGMGIALSIITWAFWAIVYNWTWIKKHAFKFICLSLLALVTVALVYQLPSVKFAVGRIVGTNGGMSAIKGRLFFWEEYFGQFAAKDLLFGFGQSTLPEEVYFTSFMVYLWAYGILGFSLYTFACGQLFVTSKLLAKYLVLVVFVLTFFANQANIAGMLYNFGVIITLCKEKH